MSVRIKQIYFREDQREHLCSDFEAFDNSQNPTGRELFEYGVMRTLYEQGLQRTAEYTGVVSWRFEQKAEISGREFIEFITANPGYDVYFINPFPHQELRFPNVWLQGEHAHPGLLVLADAIFHKLGINERAAQFTFQRQQIAYCNYWAGNETFWNQYMHFLTKVMEVINADKTLKRKVFARTHYWYDSPFFPFLIERMFSTLLCLNPALRCKKYSYSPDAMLRKYEQVIVSFQIEREKSPEFQLGWLLLRKPWKAPGWLGKKILKRTRKKLGLLQEYPK